MPGRAVPRNRARAGINYERNARTNLSIIMPALNEDIANPAGPRQVAVVNRGAPHVVPGPGLNIPAAPNVPMPLQIDEQADVEAMRAVLELALWDNVITPRHFRMAITKLKAMLPTHGPYRIPQHQTQYARILRRMARVMTPCPTTGNDQYDDHSMAVLVQDLAVECPLVLCDCLDKLLEAMSVAFSLTRGRGADDADGVVFVAVKDREAFASALRSLAARLERPLF